MPKGDWRTYRSLGRGLASLWEREEAREKARIEQEREAASEGKEAAQDTDRQKIIVALEAIPKAYLTTDDQAKREHRHQHAIEKLRRRSEKRRLWLDWFAVIGVWMAFVATVGQGTIFLFTLWHADTAANTAHKDNVKALGVAQASVYAVQRAFVIVPRLDISTERDPNTGKIAHWMFTAIFENTGNTPTVGLRATPTMSPGATKKNSVHVFYPGVRLPLEPKDPDLIYDIATHPPFKPKKLIVGPHEQVPVQQSGIPYGETEYTIPPFIYGSIHYNDIFNKPHVTKYCFIVGAVGISKKPDVGLCEHWNCADDECKGDRADYDAEVHDAFKKASKPFPADFWVRP